MRPAYLFGSSGRVRPQPIRHKAIAPPWDPSDGGGTVHTSPPPELIIPQAPDPLFFRGDFAGMTVSANRWGRIPMMEGANSTPINMLMSPMLILYPRAIQDGYLTEAAERGYTHLTIAPDGWNLLENGMLPTPSQLLDWARYIKSWGFFVNYWTTEPTMDDDYLTLLYQSGAVDTHVVGTEVDRKVTAEQYEAILDHKLQVVPGLPLLAHFTANYPSGFPRDTFLTDWSKYDGKVHLAWQADQDDSAGTQGARLYYARQRVNQGLIGDGTFGPGAPHSRVVAYETMATNQLFGEATEEDGCRRSLELLYTTRLDSVILPVSGSNNGIRQANGDPL